MSNVIFDNKLSFSIVGLYCNRVKKTTLVSIGCELSYWDGDRIAETVDQDYPQIIVNTCAVTESALYASLRVSQKLKMLFPEYKMYITGCGVDYKDVFNDIGTTLKNDIKFDTRSYENPNHGNNDIFTHYAIDEYGYVKIQEGCNNNCSYCAIPRLRKNVYSHTYQDICDQIGIHLKTGKKRISMIGTEVCKYHSEGMTLVDMVKRVLQDFPDIEVIRFNALDPSSPILDEIMELCKAERRMSKDLELSVQSCSDKVLRDMNRRYTKRRLYEIADIAGDDIRMCWHIIIGFPSETDELFEETVKVISDIRPYMISIHEYSERDGTVSSKMPYEYDIRKMKCRHSRLNELQSPELGRNNIMNTIRMSFPTQDMDSGNFKEVDLYTDGGLQWCFSQINEGFDGVFVVGYDTSKDQRELELNCKILHGMFGARTVVVFHITDENIQYFSHNVDMIYDAGVQFSVFVRFDIDRISDTESMLKLISNLKRMNICDTDTLYGALRKNNPEFSEVIYDI